MTDTIALPRSDRVVAVGVMPLLILATILATIVSNGHIVAAVAPALLALVVWAICITPLRTTLAIAMVLALSVDKPGDADGHWSSPFVTIGALAFQNMDKVLAIEPLKFSGVFALLGLLLVVRAYRALTGRERDTRDSFTLPSPLRWAFVCSTATVVALTLFGAARGGSVEDAKVQVQAFLQILAAAYLFGVSLRGVRDYQTVGALIILAACIKSALAIWLSLTMPLEFPNATGILVEREYVTSHGDSILFATAMGTLIGPLFLQPTRRHLYTCVILVPLIAFGILANDRRLAWVEVGLIVAAFIAMHPASWLTKRLARLAVLGSPLLLVYVIVGWSSQSRVFGPVHFVRTLVQAERTDGSLDRSTFFRDMENFNLVHTFRSNPLLGTGLGHRFQQATQTDSLEGFDEYGFLPHNSMLGLWAFTGFAGFSGLFMTVVVALFLGARAHAQARTADERVAITAAIGVLGAYLMHLWADIGFTEATAIFPVAIALAILGQRAAATGAWPARGAAAAQSV